MYVLRHPRDGLHKEPGCTALRGTRGYPSPLRAGGCEQVLGVLAARCRCTLGTGGRRGRRGGRYGTRQDDCKGGASRAEQANEAETVDEIAVLLRVRGPVEARTRCASGIVATSSPLWLPHNPSQALSAQLLRQQPDAKAQGSRRPELVPNCENSTSRQYRTPVVEKREEEIGCGRDAHSHSEEKDGPKWELVLESEAAASA